MLEVQAQQSKLTVDYGDTSITYPLIYHSLDSIKSQKLIAYYAFDSSRKAIEKNFYNGVISGVYREYFPNGKISIFQVYQFGVQTGDWAKYDSTGVLTEKAKYVNNKKHGFYSNRKEKYQGRYKAGLKDGKWEYNLGSATYYKRYYENGQAIGKSSLFSRVNLFQKEGDSVVLEEKVINTTIIDKSTDKKLLKIVAEQDTFVYAIRYLSRDSIPHPSMRKAVFVEKPAQTAIIKYIYQGKLNGLYKEYFPNGQLHVYANYSYGLLDGKYANYSSNGKLLSRGAYLKGEKNGRWFIRDEQGVMNKVKYKKGKAL